MSLHPWYSEQGGFFGPRYLKEYRDMLPVERTTLEVDYLTQVLGPTPGARILDLPCGHGRHSIELARRGYNVTGVDLNGFFLDKAAEAASEALVLVDFRRCDMRQVTFEGQFDIVINMFTALGYFENDEDDEKIFRNFARALGRGGKLFVDFLNSARLLRLFKPRNWRELSDGTVVLDERNHDLATGRNFDRRTMISPSGERNVVEHNVRLYSAAELVRMARAAGLVLDTCAGDWDGSELTFDSPRVLLSFQKP